MGENFGLIPLVKNLGNKIEDIIIGENAIQIETADEIFVFPKA